MKNSTNDGFGQRYNIQTAVEQNSMLIVATSLSNHPNDKKEAEPTLQALPAELGTPNAVALDNGFFSEANIRVIEGYGIQPYIATGREEHCKDLNVLLGKQPQVSAPDIGPKEKTAYKLATEIGQAIYRLRKCTVEPVIGNIKEIMSFRRFSLRGLKKSRWGMASGMPGIQPQAHAHPDALIGEFFAPIIHINLLSASYGFVLSKL
jgi:hypothetical protein